MTSIAADSVQAKRERFATSSWNCGSSFTRET